MAFLLHQLHVIFIKWQETSLQKEEHQRTRNRQQPLPQRKSHARPTTPHATHQRTCYNTPRPASTAPRLKRHPSPPPAAVPPHTAAARYHQRQHKLPTCCTTPPVHIPPR
ncbi:hypothetical protein I4F81_004200 [Pyropia yezoensis]|uniref:Uncharacterized protein n=1 Tax=Pyropia yezoensis TaxID=2788 RepID=A0ACC3BVL7_PYRYE|nr:hypothetical protein I4F81_004200 [Neopyropia yezoensis]